MAWKPLLQRPGGLRRRYPGELLRKRHLPGDGFGRVGGGFVHLQPAHGRAAARSRAGGGQRRCLRQYDRRGAGPGAGLRRDPGNEHQPGHHRRADIHCCRAGKPQHHDGAHRRGLWIGVRCLEPGVRLWARRSGRVHRWATGNLGGASERRLGRSRCRLRSGHGRYRGKRCNLDRRLARRRSLVGGHRGRHLGPSRATGGERLRSVQLRQWRGRHRVPKPGLRRGRANVERSGAVRRCLGRRHSRTHGGRLPVWSVRVGPRTREFYEATFDRIVETAIESGSQAELLALYRAAVQLGKADVAADLAELLEVVRS